MLLSVLLLALASVVSAAPWAVPTAGCYLDSSEPLCACGYTFDLNNGVLTVADGPEKGQYAYFISNKLSLSTIAPSVKNGQGLFSLCGAEQFMLYTDVLGNKTVDFNFCPSEGSGSQWTPLYLTPPAGLTCTVGPFFITEKGMKGKRSSTLYCDINQENVNPLYGSWRWSKRSASPRRRGAALKARSTPASAELKLVVGTMFRDKANYLKEWIEFHLMMGVERFLLYDNGSKDSPLDVLEPYIASGHVVYQAWPPAADAILPAPMTMRSDDAKKQEVMFQKSLATCHGNNWSTHKPFACQVAASIDMLRRSSGRAEWLGFWDIDEFIYPTESSDMSDLTSFLSASSVSTADQVVIRGSIFGSNEGDRKASKSSLVSERYVRRRALDEKRPSPFWSATQEFLDSSKVDGELAQTFRLPETTARKAIVRPEAAIWSTVHEWTPLAANVNSWQSQVVELDDGRVKLNHYAYLSRKEADEKAQVNGNPLAGFNAEQDAYYRAEEDLDIQWLVKAVALRLGLSQ